MSIYYDPTEGRVNTRLPKAILDAGKPLVNLEAYTAADMILSSNDVEMDVLDDSRLSQIKFQRLLDNGILVQRKTGRDVIHFITDHAQIAAKMQPWCRVAPPWLLLIGVFNCGRDGHLVVDGQTQKWGYDAYSTALDAWQYQSISEGHFHGCGVSILPRDNLAGAWATRWLDKLRTITDTKRILPFKHSQTIDIDDSHPWRVTLATFPGIGIDTATNIANYCGTLAQSITFLSNGEHYALKKNASYPRGIGPSKFSGARNWLGLGITDDTIEEVVTQVVPRFSKKEV